MEKEACSYAVVALIVHVCYNLQKRSTGVSAAEDNISYQINSLKGGEYGAHAASPTYSTSFVISNIGNVGVLITRYSPQQRDILQI